MTSPIEAIVVGASSGGVEAISLLLRRLPQDFSVPILIVIHLPPERPSRMAEVLAARCGFEVHEAEDKEPIVPHTVYVAPPDYHLMVEVDRRIALSSDEPVHYSRPAIDVLFETAADAYGEALVAVVLTGANNDGAEGLCRVYEAGGTALVQSPDEAAARAMPEAALKACPEAQCLSLEQIAETLQRICQN